MNHIVVMRSGRLKFQELDIDGNGFLEGYELDLLFNWMLTSFCPNGLPLPLAEKELAKEEMMRQMDSNQDGRISIEEFFVMFEEMALMLTLPVDEDEEGELGVNEGGGNQDDDDEDLKLMGQFPVTE